MAALVLEFLMHFSANSSKMYYYALSCLPYYRNIFQNVHRISRMSQRYLEFNSSKY